MNNIFKSVTALLRIAIVVMLVTTAIAAAPQATSAAKIAKDKTLLRQKSPKLLNHWGQQPASVQQLYKACSKILKANPQATFANVADDETVKKICKENDIRHFGGPMLGCLTSNSVKVWLRTTRPAKVEVCVMIDGHEQSFGPVQSTRESDLTAIVPITGLKPSTRYPYRVLVDGTFLPIPENASITTPLAEPNPRSVRIAFGTCAHRYGLGNPKQAGTILSRKPTAMLLYGDIAAQDRNNDCGRHRLDYLLRDCYPAWQKLSASVPVYTIWDDHDYFDNDRWGIPHGYTSDDRTAVRNVYCQNWNNPSYGFGDSKGGVFYRTRIGPCDIIMLDGRYFRQKGSLLGKEQMEWLERQLLDCKGPFIILASSTMWSDYVSDGKDSWGVYDPAGRERIFELIEKNHIGGVLLISGDRHGARGFRIPRPSKYNFYEFEPASLGGIDWGPPAKAPDSSQQLFGHLGYAFGEFTINADAPDPTVTFRLIGEAGNIIYEITLTRSQLTPEGQLVEH